jgi:hypothetical protein
MKFSTVISLFGGSLLTFATLTAAPADAILSENIRIAAPETAHFTPANGYTGDKTLLTRPVRQAPSKAAPPAINSLPKTVVELPRFDPKLYNEQNFARIRSILLAAQLSTQVPPVPTPAPKSE